jgi:hypothetical protein
VQRVFSSIQGHPSLSSLLAIDCHDHSFSRFDGSYKSSLFDHMATGADRLISANEMVGRLLRWAYKVDGG